MVRFLYAGYLALALYIIYPMVQDYLSTEAACLRIVSQTGVAAIFKEPDDRAGTRDHKTDCAAEARIGAIAGRASDAH